MQGEDANCQCTQRLKREVAAWRFLSHPNITQFLGIAYLQAGQLPGLVSQYMLRNNFLAYIGRHPGLKREKVRTKLYPMFSL